jgi:dTDP-4-amino-4,6-dideoxygalactose transaminase
MAKTTPDPARTVPAAKIEFDAEDRRWIAQRIDEILESGQLTLGKYGQVFEEKFAELCGTKYAVAVNSGTAALEISLRAVGVEGRDVLVPANTFFATCAAALHAGGRPILTDTDPATFGTSPEEIERKLTPDTAAVIVVHIGGLVSPRMPEIQQLCESRGVALVEDAAHGHGSSWQGTSAGAFGAAGSFSFYPTKVMTSAEGGMITTSDERIADEARIYRDQGKASFTVNAHTRLGYNWRLPETSAVIGVRHLERLSELIAGRQRAAAIYDVALQNFSGLEALPVPEGGVCNYYKRRRGVQLLQVHRAPEAASRPQGAEAGAARGLRGLTLGRGVRRSDPEAAHLRAVCADAAAPIREGLRRACLPAGLRRHDRGPGASGRRRAEADDRLMEDEPSGAQQRHSGDGEQQ